VETNIAKTRSNKCWHFALEGELCLGSFAFNIFVLIPAQEIKAVQKITPVDVSDFLCREPSIASEKI